MSLKKRFLSGSFWVIVGRGSSNLVGFVIFALLARYLGPAEFGLVAFASVFIDMTRSLALAGVPQALIQRKEWEQKTASTAFWLNMACAVGFVALMSGVVAPVLGLFYKGQFQAIVTALSLTFLIDASRAAHEAKLQRQFGYKALANRTLIGTIVGGVIGVAMAVMGFGAWALVVSRIASSVIQTAVVWISVKWAPSFTYSRDEARGLLGFGMHLGGSALLGQLNARAAELIIGAFIGTAGVGIYRIGARAINMIKDVAITPLQATALSAFARVNESGSVGKVYLRMTKACGLVAFPVYVGGAIVAPDFVLLCFGPKWGESGWVMSMLSLAGGAAVLLNFVQPALAAVHKTRLAFWNSLGILIANVAVALATVQWGVVAVALGFSVRAYISAPWALGLLKRGLGLTYREVLSGVMPPFLASLGMGAVLLAVRLWGLGDMHVVPKFCISVALGAVLYGLFMGTFFRSSLLEIKAELAPVFSGLSRKLSR